MGGVSKSQVQVIVEEWSYARLMVSPFSKTSGFLVSIASLTWEIESVVRSIKSGRGSSCLWVVGQVLALDSDVLPCIWSLVSVENSQRFAKYNIINLAQLTHGQGP